MYIVDEAAAKVTVAQPRRHLRRPAGGRRFGQNPYDFKGPAGIDCDAQGRVYVADSGNDRIQVFNTNSTRTFEAVAAVGARPSAARRRAPCCR